MTKDEKQQVDEVIECEGFSYAFMEYTDFSSIKDDEFHRLRKLYIRAYDDLEEYIKTD